MQAAEGNNPALPPPAGASTSGGQVEAQQALAARVDALEQSISAVRGDLSNVAGEFRGAIGQLLARLPQPPAQTPETSLLVDQPLRSFQQPKLLPGLPVESQLDNPFLRPSYVPSDKPQVFDIFSLQNRGPSLIRTKLGAGPAHELKYLVSVLSYLYDLIHAQQEVLDRLHTAFPPGGSTGQETLTAVLAKHLQYLQDIFELLNRRYGILAASAATGDNKPLLRGIKQKLEGLGSEYLITDEFVKNTLSEVNDLQISASFKAAAKQQDLTPKPNPPGGGGGWRAGRGGGGDGGIGGRGPPGGRGTVQPGRGAGRGQPHGDAAT
jgi:hypothetical protein